MFDHGHLYGQLATKRLLGNEQEVHKENRIALISYTWPSIVDEVSW